MTELHWYNTLDTAESRFRSDIAACRQMLRVGSHSFFAASLILPRDVREPASALYAFCRLADDAVDDGHDHQAAIAELHDRLQRMYDGHPLACPADRALSRVIEKYKIPYVLPAALIEGFEWDVAGRRYATMSELYDYAARVAGTVGVMMAMLMGARAPDVLARACDLGVAMQLTNIARDVGEDARNGRVYLPLDLLAAEGIDHEAFLRDPKFTPELGRVTQQLLDAAEGLYKRSACGISQLPVGCRPGINAARWIYSDIGRKLETLGLDSVNHRAVVGRSQKMLRLARSLMSSVRPRARDYAPPLKEVAFLVDAAFSAHTSPG
ncbi:MAG: phytoene/squalene synthase family protein [Gammaproteobacteria bacterium]